MNIKRKFKSLWNKIRRKSNSDSADNSSENIDRDPTDAEISAEEVVEEEVFPAGKMTVRRHAVIDGDRVITNKNSGRTCRARKDNEGKLNRVCGKANVIPSCSKNGNRPTNPKYQMIDPDDDTVDSGKS